MFKDKQHFIEELNKSIQKDLDAKKEELEKAAPNVGSGSNDASGSTPARKAWADKKKKMEIETDRLQDMADAKADDPKHGIHRTLAAHIKQYEAHLKSKP